MTEPRVRRGRERTGSQNLADRIAQKLRSPIKVSDDALALVRRNSEIFDVIFEEFFVIGAYPWERNREPKYLFKYPQNIQENPLLAAFCFPMMVTPLNQEIWKINDVLPNMMASTNITCGRLVPLYFPTDEHGQYLYCMRYEVNELTFPSFCHDLTFPQLMAVITRETDHFELRSTTIVLAFRSKLPYPELFWSIGKWIFESELIGRMQVTDRIDLYARSGDIQMGKNLAWPDSTHDDILVLIALLCASSAPGHGETFSMNRIPFPEFMWTRPSTKPSYLTLAHYLMSEFISRTTAPFFLKLFSQVILEKTIVVYSDDMKVETETVLLLHLLLRPFRWVSTTISSLPISILDVLDSPNPVLIGTSFPIPIVQEDMVYVDMDDKTIMPNMKMPEMPDLGDLQATLAANWKKEKASLVVDTIRKYMEVLSHAIDDSIMTDVTDRVNIKSMFLVELFLGHFKDISRMYLANIATTQMFRFMVEQKCRMKSDNAKIA